MVSMETALPRSDVLMRNGSPARVHRSAIHFGSSQLSISKQEAYQTRLPFTPPHARYRCDLALSFVPACLLRVRPSWTSRLLRKPRHRCHGQLRNEHRYRCHGQLRNEPRHVAIPGLALSVTSSTTRHARAGDTHTLPLATLPKQRHHAVAY